LTSDLPVVPEATCPPRYRPAARQMLAAEVAATRQRPVPHRRRLAVLATTGAAVLALGTGTAVAYRLMGSAPVTDTHSARCYTSISKNFGSDFPGASVSGSGNGATSAGGRGVPAQVTAPIQMCTYLWSIGRLRAESSDAPAAASGTYPVPHLAGCVLPDGTAAVFPGPDDTCQNLGLATALPG
jgi:hypothetical protein